MPGIRFLDARGGPVLHDAVLPFEPGGVALSVLEPGYRGIHGFVVHAGGEHGPVVVFPDGCELVTAGGLYARMWADYNQAVRWKITSEREGK